MLHPYIPNSHPAIQRKMLETIGAHSIEDLYGAIPDSLCLKRPMNLPERIPSEQALRRHVESILENNLSSRDLLCFKGAGCAPHYVPAVCDEVNQRSEFLTAYAGEPYEDHGRFQALFEYASLMGELLDLDVVGIPTFDWNQAASTCLRMAQRITGRNRMLVSETVSPERMSTMHNYCRSKMEIVAVPCDQETGLMDIDFIRSNASESTIGLYFENPGFLGNIETRTKELADIIHDAGGLILVGTDPISLGVLQPPVQYGADITCGDLQPLGIHMQQGGGQSGFIATKDEERFVEQYPSRLFSVTTTSVSGEWGFGDVLYDERTSFGAREKGKEFVGTGTALWAITAGVYLSLMGPKGMRQIGRVILGRNAYAMNKIASISGLSVRALDHPHFKEFVVDFSNSGMSAAEVNKKLLERAIMGGYDLSSRLSGYDQCLLFCITEIHSIEDIDNLSDSLTSILSNATTQSK